MNNYYYNLDAQQIDYWKLNPGKSMVIVIPLPEQPPVGQKYGETGLSMTLLYPLNTRMGLRETWTESERVGHYSYKTDGDIYYPDGELCKCWRSAQSMPVEAIRYWGIVTGAGVDKVQNMTGLEISHMFGINYLSMIDNLLKIIFKNWFNNRYSKTKKKWTWEDNPYCQIAVLRKG